MLIYWVKQEITINQVSWTNLSEPTNEELAQLIRDAKLCASDAKFIVQDRRRPEITVRNSYVIILYQVPVFDKKTRVTSGAALFFIISKDRLWTIHYERIVVLLKILRDYKDHPKVDPDDAFAGAIGLALNIIDHVNANSFRKIDRLSKHVEIAEDAVFRGNERKMVEEIAILMRDVLDFRKVIGPQVNLFKKLPDAKLNDENIAQWRRISNQSKQLWEILESLYNSVKELQNTNNSLLQHKENELLRLLTLYSTLAIPIWILVSPFNPFSDSALHRLIFYSVVTVLVLALLAIFISFKRKRVL